MQNGECEDPGGINAYFKNAMQWNADAMERACNGTRMQWNAHAMNADAMERACKQGIQQADEANDYV